MNKKIIPCVTMDDPVKEAVFYYDSGADAVAFFDSNASGVGALEQNLSIIREIKRNIDVPLIVCGGVRTLEDIKKLLYAGAEKVCMKSAPLKDIGIVREASDRFGSDRIIVTIDLTVTENPIEYAKALKEEGAGELLLLHFDQVENYTEICNRLRNEVGLPIIVSAYSEDEENAAKLLKESNAESITLYNLKGHDIMSIKQACKKVGIEVDVFETSIPFSEFKKDANGLVPCIVQDYKTNEVLMMAYMNEESYNMTIESGRMTYYSRSRQELWLKGLTSGHFQYVKSLTIDCDKDTILAKVSQVGAACHTGNRTCFFTPLASKDINEKDPMKLFSNLYAQLAEKKKKHDDGSYSNYLFGRGLDKILNRIGQEATEVVIASKNTDVQDLKYNISDLLYHLMVLMVEKNVTWEDILAELEERE